MVSIRTNLSSLVAQKSMFNSTNRLNSAIEKLSTGYKINHASDNAAGYSIATDMTTKLNAYEVAQDNTSMGLDMVNTASGALDEIQDRLSRLRSLSEQATNGTYGEDSIKAIKSEARALEDEILRLYNTTEYNGQKLLGECANRGFMCEIETVTPDVVVTNASDLADAITNNTIIGIDNADVLHELATLVNAGNTCSGKTFILTDDIDLSDYQEGEGWTPIGYGSDSNHSKAFQGTFDGQEHVVTNLKINGGYQRGLFGQVYMGSVKNLAVQNCDINGTVATGGFIGYSCYSNIENCYVTGSVKSSDGSSYTGGFAGICNGSKVKNCYSEVSVEGSSYVGGFAGVMNCNGVEIINCHSTGNVKGDNSVGGIVGNVWQTGAIIDNCYSTGNVNGSSYVSGVVKSGSSIPTVTDSYSYGTVKRGSTIVTDAYTKDASESPLKKKQTNLQVGINSDESSRISFVTEFDINDVIGIASGIKNTSTLEKIDSLISKVSQKQTELGAVQNRLESALDSISTNIENLTSSRSTLRDADIAKVSSQFIQQQILQQAAATLMSTANQSPSIALQLI